MTSFQKVPAEQFILIKCFCNFSRNCFFLSFFFLSIGRSFLRLVVLKFHLKKKNLLQIIIHFFLKFEPYLKNLGMIDMNLKQKDGFIDDDVFLKRTEPG